MPLAAPSLPATQCRKQSASFTPRFPRHSAMMTIPNSAHTWAKHHKPSSDRAHLSDVQSTAHSLMHSFVYHWMVNTTVENPVADTILDKAFLLQLTTLDHNKYQYIHWYSVIPWQPYSNSHTFHRQVSWYEQSPLRWHHPLKSPISKLVPFWI